MKLPRYWPVATVAVLAAVALWYTHDIYWWPPDEGYFAHIAERVAAGAVYGVDVLGVHGGYQVFLNALLFDIFGTELSVLRYPILVLLVGQAAIAAYLVRHHGSALMLAVGFVPLTLGYWQFANPSPNWYALAFVTLIALLLVERERIPRAWFLMGGLLGVMLLFRHPSALIAGSGLLASLLLCYPGAPAAGWGGRWLTRGALAWVAGITLLIGFLFFEAAVAVLFVFPIGVVLGVIYFIDPLWSKRHTAALRDLCLGGALAVLPMVIYLLWHGALVSWLESLFFSNTGLTSSAFFGSRTYVAVAYSYVSYIWDTGEFGVAVLHAVYWSTLLLLPLGLSGVLLYQWRRFRVRPAPEAVLAIVFGLVSVYYQIPFYLYCSIGFVLLILVRTVPLRGAGRAGVFVGLLFLQGIALMYSTITHALIVPDQFSRLAHPRADLVMETTDRDEYRALLTAIATSTEPGDAIYAFPFNPDLYFLSERTNPFPFVGSMLGVTTEAAYQAFLRDFAAAAPTLVVADLESKYYGPFDVRFRSYLQAADSDYVFSGVVDGREIYVRLVE